MRGSYVVSCGDAGMDDVDLSDLFEEDPQEPAQVTHRQITVRSSPRAAMKGLPKKPWKLEIPVSASIADAEAMAQTKYGDELGPNDQIRLVKFQTGGNHTQITPDEWQYSCSDTGTVARAVIVAKPQAPVDATGAHTSSAQVDATQAVGASGVQANADEPTGAHASAQDDAASARVDVGADSVQVDTEARSDLRLPRLADEGHRPRRRRRSTTSAGAPPHAAQSRSRRSSLRASPTMTKRSRSRVEDTWGDTSLLSSSKHYQRMTTTEYNTLHCSFDSIVAHQDQAGSTAYGGWSIVLWRDLDDDDGPHGDPPDRPRSHPPSQESIVYEDSGGRVMAWHGAEDTSALEAATRALEAAAALSCRQLDLYSSSQCAIDSINTVDDLNRDAHDAHKRLRARIRRVMADITKRNMDNDRPVAYVVATEETEVLQQRAQGAAEEAFAEFAPSTVVGGAGPAESTIVTAIAGPGIRHKGGTGAAAWAIARITGDPDNPDGVSLIDVGRMEAATSPAEAHAYAAVSAVTAKIADTTIARLNVSVGDKSVPKMASGTYTTSSKPMQAAMTLLRDQIQTADQHGEGLIRFTYMTRQDTNLWAFRATQRAAKLFLQSGDRDEAMRST